MALTPTLLESGYRLDTIVSGPKIDTSTNLPVPHGILDLAFDSTEKFLWVSSILGQSILKVKLATGQIVQSEFARDPGEIGTVKSGANADDVYWADGPKIFKLAGGTGSPITVVDMSGSFDPFNGILAMVLNQSTKTSAGTSEKLYFSDFTGGIWEADLLGALPVTAPTVKVAGGPPYKAFFLGMAMNDDTNLYVSNLGLLTVETYDVSGTPPPPLVPTTLHPFALSTAQALDSQGNLYIADLLPLTGLTGPVEETIIRKINLTTREITDVAQLPAGTGSIERMRFRTDDRLFLTGLQRGALLEMIERKGRIRFRPIRKPILGTVQAPGGVAVHTDTAGQQSVYVADFEQVLSFDADTGAERWVAGFLETYGAINRGNESIDVSIWSDDSKLLVCSVPEEGGYLGLFDRETGKISSFRLLGAPLAAEPMGGNFALVVDYSDFYNPVPRIVKVNLVDPRPTGLTVIDNTLANPAGITISSTGDAWATNWHATDGKIYKIMSGGSPIAPVEVIGGLVKPEGIALDIDGTALVVEADTGVNGGRLTRVNLSTAAKTTVVDNLDLGLLDPTVLPGIGHMLLSGVDVDTDGTIVFTLDKANQILKLTPDA